LWTACLLTPRALAIACHEKPRLRAFRTCTSSARAAHLGETVQLGERLACVRGADQGAQVVSAHRVASRGGRPSDDERSDHGCRGCGIRRQP
jgi:hypothetical protein